MNLASRYFLEFAAAFVRGKASQGETLDLPDELREPPLDALTETERERLFEIGEAAGLKLYKFKRAIELPRVKRVIGALRGFAPSELLDIGSGRGVFLWPLLDAFPELPITAIDQNPLRASDLDAVHRGGVDRLTSHGMDATQLDFDEATFDGVTMLEVLEHIPEAERVLSEVIRVARRFVVLTVPSQEDDNPEHIHLFDQKRLRTMFLACGVDHVRFDFVPGHLMAVATLPGVD